MILKTKVYFEVDAKISPEDLDLLQEFLEDTVVESLKDLKKWNKWEYDDIVIKYRSIPFKKVKELMTGIKK